MRICLHRIIGITAISLIYALACSAGDVSIKDDGGKWKIAAGLYEATMEKDGCLSSLIVNKREFIDSKTGVSKGVYLWYDNKINTYGAVSQNGASSLAVDGELCKMVCDFREDRIAWTINSKVTKGLTQTMVLDPGVSTIRDEIGTYQKLPVNKNFQKAGFQNGESFADFTFPANTFGPWGNRCQVVTAGIPPGESRTFEVVVGKLSSEDLEKICGSISNPPPATENKNISSGPVEKIKVDAKYLNDVPKYWPADVGQVDWLNAIFYEGPDYKGKPSKVFAYYGIPSVKNGEKVPAMVLVHGGVGTAYSDWVKLWVSRGYAAIAMDLCGSLPIRDADGKKWKKISDGGGPAGWEVSFSQINEPLQDQWPCYAVNAIARARTLIGSFPEVDNSRVGITGISWGGFLTCIVAGLDSRYLFAVPVYDCGSLRDNSAWSERLKLPGMDKWCLQFDPIQYLPDAKMPLLWVCGTNDNFYPLLSLQKSYALVKTPVSLCIKPRMVHSHGGPGEKPEEIRAFADSFCKGGQQLATITEQGMEKDGTAWVQWKSPVKIEKAEFLYTKDSGVWKERKWESAPAPMNPDSGKVSFKLPEGVTTYYFNITDSRGLVSSSRHVECVK